MEEELAKKAEVLRKLAESEWWTGDIGALKHSQEALELYQELNDLPNVAMMHRFLATVFDAAAPGVGDETKALRHAEAALAILEPGPDNLEKGLTYQTMAHMHLHTDEPATSVIWAQKAADLFEKLGMFMGTSLGTAQARVGELDTGYRISGKQLGAYC